ncbi:MAG: ACP S-malonyltransferase [Clostridia bacterium]|nr:ACP S-malonyltransferase [Clostridia bacterium]
MNKIALLFPGQGSQYVGMAKKLYDLYEDVRETFEEANNALGFDLKSLCFEGSMEDLTKTENTQPAILTASVAAFRAYMREIGIQPLFMAGHSLGEFTALSCAGAIKFSDAVKIVRQRGKFMQEAVAVGVGGMAAVSGVSRDIIEEECVRASNGSNIVVVSNYNAPDQIVISGHIAAVNEAGEKLAQKGARVIPLKVSAPFHSPLMQPAADRLREELMKYKFSGLNFPVISNVTAMPYPDKESIVEYLAKQIVQPVKWQASMEYMQNQGVEWVVEAGPQTVLRNLMKKNAPAVKAFSYDSDQDVGALKRLVSPEGQQAEGIKQGMSVITKCIATAICTKNSNWDEQEYQTGVVQPYRKIKNMKDEIEKEGRQPQIEEIKAALEMLKSVFITKKTPKEEQRERFNEIFEATGIGQVLQDFEIPS